MDPILFATLGFAGLFLLIFLSVPIGIAMAIVGLVGFGFVRGMDPALSLFSTQTVGTLSSGDLAVIPLFMLLGALSTVSGLSGDLYRLLDAFVGHKRGGLAYATMGACAGFGSICGSSPATAATMGQVALPEMLDRGYSPALATGTIAAGGTLGMIIPPSIVMVLYAYLTEQFVIDLFIAALIPAMMAVVLQVTAIRVVVGLRPELAPQGERLDWRTRLETARRSWGVVLLMGIVLVGLYSGKLTVNEIAGVADVIALGFCIARGNLTVGNIRKVIAETASNTAMIYVIIIGSGIFTYFVVATRLPAEMTSLIGSLDMPPLLIIGILLVAYLILGAVFDEVASLVITLPFVLPIIIGLGYDVIWWGIVMVIVIELGMITPPIGLNVFVIYNVAKRKVPLKDIFSGVTPFIIADLLRLALVVLFPQLILWLPTILK